MPFFLTKKQLCAIIMVRRRTESEVQKMIHSFLLIGQSNMAGRGLKGEAEPIRDPRLKVLRNGRWQHMFFPVNPDRASAGFSLAESFALAYAEEHGVEVGLIPCADGGTSLDQWQEGGLLYDHAVYMCRLAERTSTIAGVLWHQGESDCSEDRYPFYEAKFTAIMNALRRDLALDDVPFLLGGLGDYLKKRAPKPEGVNYWRVNEALQSIAQSNPMTGFVPATGLGANADGLHFKARALREFGLRYYEVFKTLEDKSKLFSEKAGEDYALRTDMELL